MWEYKTDTFEADDLEGWLNTASGMGWELIHYRWCPDIVSGGGSHEVIMKRPAPQ